MERNEKDYSISLVRFVAMVFVFVCHVCKQYNAKTTVFLGAIEWKDWFNVGVQCFLLISGYLYGKRGKINNMVDWYKRVFLKILVDYYVFVAIMIPVYYLLAPNRITYSDVFRLLTFSGTVEGLGHLWYISTILFCYFLTPFFVSISDEICDKSFSKRVIYTLMIFLMVQLIVMLFFDYFSGAWINCYLIGVFYSCIEKKRRTPYMGVIFIFIGIIGVLLQLYGELVNPRIELMLNSVWGLFRNYVHVMLGFTMMISLRWIWNNLGEKIRDIFITVLNWSDNYSYDVYFVHAVFTQGVFSTAWLVKNTPIAILLALIATVLSAMILRVICVRVKH